MKCSYEFFAVGKCPEDGSDDPYRVVIEADHMIPVESILEQSAAILADPIFQEDYTARLAGWLGARVSTSGNHKGVQTKCTV